MWPWKRNDVEKAHREELEAELQRRLSEQRKEEAERLARESSNITARLRRQIELNGWTELLQNAWGAR